MFLAISPPSHNCSLFIYLFIYFWVQLQTPGNYLQDIERLFTDLIYGEKS